MLTIRKAEFSDLKLLVKMGKETFSEAFGKDNKPQNLANYLSEAFDSKKIAFELRDIKNNFFLVFDGEFPVGYAKMRENDEVKKVLKERAIELERLYVVSNYQRKKVGTLLMQTCVDHAQLMGFYWIWLGVWENNFKAQHFYAKWGFEKFGEHVFQMGDDPQTDWVMKKRILK